MSRTRARTRDLTRVRRPARRVPAEPLPAERVPADDSAGFLARAAAWVLVLGGLAGIGAAFALTLDRIALLKDPAFVPSCSISPLLSCGSVMTSPQAEVFGFPNPLVGLVAFPVVTTVGVLALAGGAVPRWVWTSPQDGYPSRPAGSRLAAYHGVLLTCWLLVIVALIASRFWSYWTGLVP